MLDEFAACWHPDRLLEKLPDAIVVVDAAGVVTYASPAVESLIGAQPDQLVGSNAFDHVHPDDQLDAFENFQSTVSTVDSRPTPVLLRLRHTRGDWIESELVATNHLDDPTIAGLLLTIRNVSASMRTEQSLRESEARYRLIVELAHEGILMVDNDSLITFANRALARILRTTVVDLVGRSMFDLMDIEADPGAARFAKRQADGSHDLRLLAADGTRAWVRLSASTLRLPDGLRTGLVAVVTDITERRALEEQLAHDARHDALTGVANRHSLFATLADTLEHGTRCAVLFADVDHFKAVNDACGHQAGDEVLRITAARIGAAVRTTDTIARVGGDEFVVVCEPIERQFEAVGIGARIIAALNEPIPIRRQRIESRVSVGIAFAEPDDTPDSILARADHAMYTAKRAGRNRLHVATPPSFSRLSQA